MALSEDDKNTLEEIVELDGECLDGVRCRRCPFRAICLPEFLNPIPPSQPQRLKMAQDVLTHHYLIDEDIEVAGVESEFQWDKR
jgi:hypothetical protein